MVNETRRTFRCRPEAIERLREARGLSVEALSRKSGIHQRTIKRWLDGRPGLLSSIKLVAAALGACCDDLLADRTGVEPPPEHRKPARFHMRINLKGRFQSSSQKDYLVRLTPDIIRGLAQEGIIVTGQKSVLATTDFAVTDAPLRILVGFPGMSDGKPCWGLAAIKPGLLKRFLGEHDLDADEFTFGEIIAAGRGPRIPRAAIKRVTRLFQCPKTTILDAMA